MNNLHVRNKYATKWTSESVFQPYIPNSYTLEFPVIQHVNHSYWGSPMGVNEKNIFRSTFHNSILEHILMPAGTDCWSSNTTPVSCFNHPMEACSTTHSETAVYVFRCVHVVENRCTYPQYPYSFTSLEGRYFISENKPSIFTRLKVYLASTSYVNGGFLISSFSQ